MLASAKIRKNRECNFIFWYRVSYVLQRKKHRFARSWAKKINNRIKFRFCCDVSRKSSIDIGFQIGHLAGIVIAQNVKIGKNFVIRQNTTIGTSGHKKNPVSPYDIEIGDNVNLGANCCIIGNGLKIGSQVTIAAMSFVNKDIPSNVIYITKKNSEVKCKPLEPVSDAQGDS